ncbi:dnaJ homolog subfamily B member 7-like [Vigna unguiculata]|uniref:DnaJ-like protein subfamily B member 6 n=1 Tax=Vigna unguiculata TaxID=3917 RepID=A0A4D6MBB4_VIGUN|nr:dnaJ homolog subfamily B member 7-like [Vigna unguiculata]QCD98257.1 DnaJ-like protein subfamily B member 6 [Vigna unguiculata]
MSNDAVCFYSVLGIGKHSSDGEIRCAYRKMALKWHPDRWSKDPKFAPEAKKRFQHVQEAYSVLSNTGKRRIYDAGLFGLIGEDDDEGFVDFMQEMILMMQNERPKDEKGTTEDLQGLLRDMMMKENEGIGESGFSCNSSPCPTKRTRIS